MPFTDPSFALFVAAVFAVYYAPPLRAWQPLTLVVASRQDREEQAAWLAPAITPQGWMLAGGTKW